jgi:ABC-type multidrug transport system fused ATPase/permease subunit
MHIGQMWMAETQLCRVMSRHTPTNQKWSPAYNGGLGEKPNADEMSQGEKQLFSMARAILRRDCKIVVLDEVSST